MINIIINELISTNQWKKKSYKRLPLKYHVTLGVGAPTALQVMVASLPSKTVRFAGALCIIGGDATSHTVS